MVNGTTEDLLSAGALTGDIQQAGLKGPPTLCNAIALHLPPLTCSMRAIEPHCEGAGMAE